MLFRYKPDEGRNARQIAFWFGEAVTAFACMAFAGLLDSSTTLRAPLFDGIERVPVFGVVLSGSFLIALLAFGLLSWAWVRFLAKKKYSQHLIEVEAEIHKVTWPTFKEASNSSFVVIGTVLVLMAFLALADWLLGELFRVILWEA
jgi:preprotein translocase subunit SecE